MPKSAKATSITIEPTLTEDLVANARLAANQQSAVVRGWKAITPDVIEASRASDEARTAALSAHYLAKFQ